MGLHHCQSKRTATKSKRFLQNSVEFALQTRVYLQYVCTWRGDLIITADSSLVAGIFPQIRPGHFHPRDCLSIIVDQPSNIRRYIISVFFSCGAAALVLEVSRSHIKTHHIRQDFSGRVISPSQRSLPDNTQQSTQTTIYAPGGISKPQSHQASCRRTTP